MSIHVAIRHTTRYTFDRRVTLSPHVIRLRPAPHSRTPILAYTMKVTPEKRFISWQQDPFGNYLARRVFPEATREFSVDVDPFAVQPPLADFHGEIAARFREKPSKRPLARWGTLLHDRHMLPIIEASVNGDRSQPAFGFVEALCPLGRALRQACPEHSRRGSGRTYCKHSRIRVQSTQGKPWPTSTSSATKKAGSANRWSRASSRNT
jgi:hypothetical protein